MFKQNGLKTQKKKYGYIILTPLYFFELKKKIGQELQKQHEKIYTTVL